jgi:hypothetical protein
MSDDINKEEEISLSGDEAKPAKQAKTKDAESTPTSPLAEIVNDRMSNDDVLDAIIQAPDESIIPWEDIELPSKGLYYGWSSGVIQGRAWGINVDKILSTQRLAQTGQSIDHVLRACCRFPDGFDPQDLLVGDQIFLLYYLRAATHGNQYEFAIKNPATGEESMHSADLNELSQTITWADKGLGPEPFKISLPYFSEQLGREVWVSVRFLRVRDVQNINKTKRAINKSQFSKVSMKKKRQDIRNRMNESLQQNAGPEPVALDDTLTKHMETLIVDVMGNTERFKITEFMNKMHSTDSATIRDWLADHSPGIDTTVEVPDSNNDTGGSFQVSLPITEAFFRSQKR